MTKIELALEVLRMGYNDQITDLGVKAKEVVMNALKGDL